MYITYEGHTYYKGTSQCHTRSPYLILMQHKDLPLGEDNFRALVRKVALQQFGPFMMSVARIKGHSITVSGAYGCDGLPFMMGVARIKGHSITVSGAYGCDGPPFMMGVARIKGHSITVSGAYGCDGFPCTTSFDEVYEAAVPVPKELYHQWAHGEGWNSASSEAENMAKWARETFLTRKRRNYYYEKNRISTGG